MRGILIDPAAKLIHEVEYNGDYRQISKRIECDLFTVVGIDGVNSIFVDDEGLLKDIEDFFTYGEYPQPLAGKGLILGCDEAGESIATTLTVAEVAANVSFLKLSVLGFEETEGVTTKYGMEMPFIASVPVFGPPKSEKPNE
jgi:hypothetical protein